MRHRMHLWARRTLVAAALGTTACGGRAGPAAASPDASVADAAVRTDAGSGGDASAPDASIATDGPPCSATSQSDLPGVHIDIDTSRCVFTLAEASAGIGIGYDVVVDTPVAGVSPRAQDAGGCGAPDGSGLIPFESLAGGGQSYCVCDTGLCAPQSKTPITLAAGHFHHVFSWNGTNWSGPSDTGTPQGPPFPAGTYTLTVSAVGSTTNDGGARPFRVAGTMAITLVP